MGWTFIGNTIVNRRGGGSLSSYWSHQPEVLFFGLYSEISGGQMPNKVTGATDYLTVAGSAGSETYQCPNTAPYLAADTDDIWFYSDDLIRIATTAELIGYDFTRTIVYYGDTAPNAIVAIMILSSDVDTAKMRNDFHLSIWWDNVLSSYGNVKSNRGIGKSVWTPESAIPTGLTLTLISGGVKIDWTDNTGGTAQTEIWVQNDGGVSALIYTINAGTVTKNDNAVTPVDLRYYKLRAKNDSAYSAFTAEVSIAMLSVEKCVNGDFSAGTNWTFSQAQISIVANKLNFNAAGNTHYAQNSATLTIGKTYRTIFTVSDRTGGSVYISCGGSGLGTYRSTNNTFIQNIVCAGDTKIYMCASGITTANVDNISVKEVLNP